MWRKKSAPMLANQCIDSFADKKENCSVEQIENTDYPKWKIDIQKRAKELHPR